jgi:hypothetical protein
MADAAFEQYGDDDLLASRCGLDVSMSYVP